MVSGDTTMVDAVATALTACGIETVQPTRNQNTRKVSCNSTYRLRYWNWVLKKRRKKLMNELQQHLPLAVLKLTLTETFLFPGNISCNSTYRLRYWNLNYISYIYHFRSLQQHLPLAVLKLILPHIKTKQMPTVATALTACGIETALLWWYFLSVLLKVATALTACGIET